MWKMACTTGFSCLSSRLRDENRADSVLRPWKLRGKKGVKYGCFSRLDDPVYRDNAGSSGSIFSEKGNRPLCTEGTSGVCVGSDGGGICVVASDPGNGYVLPSGKICFCTGGRRIFSRSCLSAGNG